MEAEKIESSAEALRVRHHPIIFPSEKNFATRLTGNCEDKTAKNGKTKRVENCEQIAHTHVGIAGLCFPLSNYLFSNI
jgi:hypothetical protein